jgi:hypothetical protein
VQQHPVGAYGAAAMPLVGQSTGVPGWAMFLLGLLGGFLITLALFKFTPLAEGLRPDLIQYGKDLVKRETPSDPSAAVRNDDSPAPAPAPSDEGDGGGGGGPVEDGGGDAAEEPTEGDEGP